MAFTLDSITNQKEVLIYLKKGDKKQHNDRNNAVMFGVTFQLMDDIRWGKIVDSLNPPPEEDELEPGERFLNTLLRHKAVIKKICMGIVVLEDFQFNLTVTELDSDNKPLLDDNGDIKTKQVAANLKKGDALEGENLEAILSIMAVVQQLFDYYSKNCQNVHQRDTDKDKKK